MADDLELLYYGVHANNAPFVGNDISNAVLSNAQMTTGIGVQFVDFSLAIKY